jgi:hypothetical protein
LIYVTLSLSCCFEICDILPLSSPLKNVTLS